MCHCGTRKDEWQEDRFAYVAMSERCPGCEILEQESATHDKDAKGVRSFLVKNTPETQRMMAEQA